MKKNLTNNNFYLKKNLRIMKLTTILILICIIPVSASTYAQGHKVSVHVTNGTFYDVVTQIEKQSEFMFFYKSEEIENSQRVTIAATDKLVPEILDEMLNASGLKYEIKDRHIIISKKAPSAPAINQQQGRTITGVIRDASDVIIGANVFVKGTTIGSVTDINGQFTISNVPNNAVLVISYIGYISQEVTVGSQSAYNITLIEDLQLLDEVIVIGYGTQQRRDISSSITTVSAEDIKDIPVTTFAAALMGQAAGVYVMSSGSPGATTTMRIRGVGSVNAGGSDPLVIVDGISGVDIASINPNDIENFSILKDASATAIYGARGANGVILITTRQGSKNSGKVNVSYDGYFGLSTLDDKGYNLLGGWEHMEFVAQGMVNARDFRGISPGTHGQFGRLDANDQLTMPYAIKPAGYSKQDIINQWGSVDNWVASYRPDGTSSWMRSAYYQMLEDGYSEEEARKGTNWYKQVVRTGKVQDHNLSIQGGNGEKGMYALSLGVTLQEGTFLYSFMDRYTLRTNVLFNPTKYLSIGGNVNLSAIEYGGEREGGVESSIFSQSVFVKSWVPVYAVDGIHLAGSQAPESGSGNTSMTRAEFLQKNNTDFNFRGQASVFAEIKPISGLTIRTQYSPSLNGRWQTSFSPISIFANGEGQSINSYSETSNYSFTWQWTNTVNYNKTFNLDHNLKITAGTEAIDQNRMGRTLSASRRDYAFENDPNTWTINNGGTANLNNSGSRSTHYTLFGYFGRAEYSYKSAYILNTSIRRDASSRFGANNRWGTFPSVSVAWRMSDMAFMEPTRGYINDLKLRAGFGTTGNSNTGDGNAYNWAFQYGTGNAHLYDIQGANTSVWTGYGATTLGDASAKWETVRTINLGVDVTALKQRLSTSIEWYTRKTTDMLVQADWSALSGAWQGGLTGLPRTNNGDMVNKGVDFSVGWRDRTRLFGYNISANISTYRNKVLRLGSADIFSSNRLSNTNITTAGQPIGMFYGYKVLGVYKSEQEVIDFPSYPYGADPDRFTPNNWVGRFIIEDYDGDGRITVNDRKIIGNPHPDFTGGLNASINYRGFDLSTHFYFSVGNDLYKLFEHYTSYGTFGANYSVDRRDNSWHPANNPDGKYPMWAGISNEGAEAATVSHSMYIEDGSYLRMRTLTLGYSLPRNMLRSINLERVRLYLQMTNAFTLTKYSGLEPEVRSGNALSGGIDYGAYGMPRQYIVGVNIAFK